MTTSKPKIKCWLTETTRKPKIEFWISITSGEPKAKILAYTKNQYTKDRILQLVGQRLNFEILPYYNNRSAKGWTLAYNNYR